MAALLDRYSNLVLNHPWRVVLLALLLVLLAGGGAAQLKFTTDYRVYFSDDNPELVAFEAMENDFTRSEAVLIGVEPVDGEVFNIDTLQALKKLVSEGNKLPYARAAYAITNVYEAQADGDDIMAAPILPDKPLETIDLDAFKARAMGNPRLRDGLLAANGDVTGVVIYIELPHEDSSAEIARVAEASRELSDRIAAEHPRLKFHLTGLVMFNHALSEAIQKDAEQLYPLSYLVMFALLALFFRGVSSMVTTVAVVLMSVLTGLGLAGWLGIQLNTTSIASGIIILTLAIADCVHLLTSFTHERQQGAERLAAMRESLRINFQPIFLTSLTTAIGFLGMNFSDAPPNRDLGNIVAMGVGAAFLFSVSFLPAFLMLIPLGEPRERVQLQNLMRSLAEFVIRYRRPLFWGN
ncbi:MAG: efflux RND transporter permease subunit, partial [Nevskiales bacterium]